MSRLLVIIVTYNAMQWIERCFASLEVSEVAPDVFVVDNGSTDGTREWLIAHKNEYLCVHFSERNLGFGAANNIGLRLMLEEGYEYAYLLNQDAWVEKDCFGKLIAAFENGDASADGSSVTNAHWGILSPLQMKDGLTEEDENFHKHCGRAVAACADDECAIFDDNDAGRATADAHGRIAISYAADSRARSVDAPHIDDAPCHISCDRLCQSSDGNDRNLAVPVKFVMAAHWMLSRECVEAVGGFSPTFDQYGEDENYVNRAKFFGFGVGVVPSAKAVHDRAKRITPIEKRLKIKYIGCRARLSNPGLKCPVATLIVECFRIVGMAIYNLSPTMLAYLPKLMREYRLLSKNRKLSIEKGAFL